jgi:hypothetical protein
MTELDWLIVAATVLFAISGFFRGLIVAVLSLAGFVVGAFIGARVAGALLSGGSSSPYAPAFALLGALLVGGVLATGLRSVGVAMRRSMLAVPVLRLIDGLGGALFGAALALGLAWVAGTVALTLPGTSGLRGPVERSKVLRELDELLPSGTLLNLIARIDPLPSITGPFLGVASPPADAAILRASGVLRARRSVVRVIGSACGIGIEGSGWVVRPDEVLTNAHVVAGESTTTVEIGGSAPGQTATVVLFDAKNDLAVLRVPNLALPALALAHSPGAGTAGVILGYPEDGPFAAEPGRIGRTQRVQTDNAYGRGPVVRALTPLRGLVRPGNSGGPVVDAEGRVLTTVFAASTSPGPSGGYGVANGVVRRDLARVRGPVSTDGCTA